MVVVVRGSLLPREDSVVVAVVVAAFERGAGGYSHQGSQDEGDLLKIF